MLSLGLPGPVAPQLETGGGCVGGRAQPAAARRPPSLLAVELAGTPLGSWSATWVGKQTGRPQPGVRAPLADLKQCTPPRAAPRCSVVTRYKSAAEIANQALGVVIAACKPGAKVVEVCDLGDNVINE